MSAVSKISQQVFQKMDMIRRLKGLSWAEILRKLKILGINLSRCTPYDWKMGKSCSFLNYATEISSILGVSASELDIAGFGYTNNGNINNLVNEGENSVLHINQKSGRTLSKQESELLDIFNEFSLENQYKLLGYAFKLRDEK